MLIMKAVIVLVACFTISIPEVHSAECVPDELQHFDPSELDGIWYINYVKPNIFNKISDIKEIMEFSVDRYIGNLTTNFNGDEPEVHNAVWIVDGTVLDAEFDGLSNFNSLYRILATDYTTFFICQGHPEATDGGAVTVIHMRNRCSDEAAVQVMKDGVARQCLDFNDFTPDPSLETECAEK